MDPLDAGEVERFPTSCAHGILFPIYEDVARVLDGCARWKSLDATGVEHFDSPC
jgi:hypothetical protein